jgi:hypothetical protein
MDRLVGIDVECPQCEKVRVGPASVTLRVCLDDVEWSYWFVCPDCGGRAAGSTEQGPALEAIAAGSPFESWRLPAEMSEPHEGPPIQIFDLLELKLELMQPDVVETLRQGAGGAR